MMFKCKKFFGTCNLLKILFQKDVFKITGILQTSLSIYIYSLYITYTTPYFTESIDRQNYKINIKTLQFNPATI